MERNLYKFFSEILVVDCNQSHIIWQVAFSRKENFGIALVRLIQLASVHTSYIAFSCVSGAPTISMIALGAQHALHLLWV